MEKTKNQYIKIKMETNKIIAAITFLIAFTWSFSAQELTNNIHFRAGSIVVDKESYDELYDIADIMQALPDYEFLIAGHVDSANSRASGIKISKQRADAVASFLIDAGVSPSQIESIGYGNTKPKFNNSKSSGRSKNRRVEISLKGSEEAIDTENLYDDDIDASFDIKQIAEQYNIPVRLLKEWNDISGKLSFLEGKNDQLNKNIHFRSGSVIIRNSSRDLLSLIADFMVKYPNTEFTLGGHTDSLGSDAYNKEISQGRANAVKEFLIKSGVKRANLKTVAFGYSRPKFMNKNTWGKTQLNRRVEIIFDALNAYNVEKQDKIEAAQVKAQTKPQVQVQTKKIVRVRTPKKVTPKKIVPRKVVPKEVEIEEISDVIDYGNMRMIYHKVLKKQTLFSISQMYSVNIKNLRKWNHLKSNKIYTSQTLVLYVKK